MGAQSVDADGQVRELGERNLMWKQKIKLLLLKINSLLSGLSALLFRILALVFSAMYYFFGDVVEYLRSLVHKGPAQNRGSELGEAGADGADGAACGAGGAGGADGAGAAGGANGASSAAGAGGAVGADGAGAAGAAGTGAANGASNADSAALPGSPDDPSQEQARGASKKSAPLSVYEVLPFFFDSIIIFFSIPLTAMIFEEEFAGYSSGFLVKNMTVFLLVAYGNFLLLNTYSCSIPWPLCGLRASYKALLYTFDHKKAMAPIFVAIMITTVLFTPLMMLMGQLERLALSTISWNVVTCCGGVALVRRLVVFVVSRVMAAAFGGGECGEGEDGEE
jgi:hypothetical protein